MRAPQGEEKRRENREREREREREGGRKERINKNVDVESVALKA